MVDSASLKNLVLNVGEKSYLVDAPDIYKELGITENRFAELLARDYYCPVVSTEPTSSTLTYVDTDGSINHFAIGQECRIPDVESGNYRMFKFMGTYQGRAVWMRLADKVSDLDNNAGYITEEQAKSIIRGGPGSDDEGAGGSISFVGRTTIQINQAIKDPASMVTRTVDEGGIEAIRANSHRYTGKLISDGVMGLKQLDDTDGTKYLDGSPAELTTLGTDVWMKLPSFYWKCTNLTDELIEISFSYGYNPGDGWNYWDGKDLIGVYEAVYSDEKLYSVSGQKSFSGNYNRFHNFAIKRGNGYSIIRWKHHCMMAVLFYAMYTHTDSQGLVGTGVDSYTEFNGQTDLLGMEDTVASINGNSQSINFWGLENWWGGKKELIYATSSGLVLKVTEDDGTVRTVGNQVSSNGYISKLLFGEKMDLLPIAVSGSSTSGFCDRNVVESSTIQKYASRSNYSSSLYGGVSYLDASLGLNSSSQVCGTRLIFRGEFVVL